MTLEHCTRKRRIKSLFISACSLAAFGKSVLGQDALRVSVAGEAAAEGRTKANGTVGYYNLKMGDLRLRVLSAVSVEGNDNVNLTSNHKVGDVIFRPSVNSSINYPFAEKNSLNFNINIGYSAYAREHSLNQFFITPGTELSFDIYVSDFLFNFHDRLSITEQSYENPAVSSVANYSYLENVAGMEVLWDLNKVQISAGYDHLNRLSLDSAFNQEDSSQELFSLKAGYDLNSVSVTGVETTAGIIQYDQSTLNGGVQYSAGLFYRLRLSKNFNLRVAGGYFMDYVDSPVTTSTNYQQNVGAFYGSVSLEHQITQHFNYVVKAGREVEAGFTADTLDLYYARLQANWSGIRQWPVAAYFLYENGKETGGIGEKIERYGVCASVSHNLTQKLAASLAYSFWDRFSNLPDRGYIQNQIVMTLNYSF